MKFNGQRRKHDNFSGQRQYICLRFIDNFIRRPPARSPRPRHGTVIVISDCFAREEQSALHALLQFLDGGAFEAEIVVLYALRMYASLFQNFTCEATMSLFPAFLTIFSTLRSTLSAGSRECFTEVSLINVTKSTLVPW